MSAPSAFVRWHPAVQSCITIPSALRGEESRVPVAWKAVAAVSTELHCRLGKADRDCIQFSLLGLGALQGQSIQQLSITWGILTAVPESLLMC